MADTKNPASEVTASKDQPQAKTAPVAAAAALDDYEVGEAIPCSAQKVFQDEFGKVSEIGETVIYSFDPEKPINLQLMRPQDEEAHQAIIRAGEEWRAYQDREVQRAAELSRARDEYLLANR